jgi:hypothetical protein
MQPNELKANSVYNSAKEVKAKTPAEDQPEPEMSFDQLCDCMNNFFNSKDYESKQAFRTGFNSIVGEDYTNIDMLTNLTEIAYNYCCNKDTLTKSDKRNMKNICKGIQQVFRGLEQYDTSVRMDNVLIAQLMGYILKITRNYFHDRRRKT